MTRLVFAEIARLSGRRIIGALAGLVLAATVVAAIAAFLLSHEETPAAIQARAQRDQVLAQCTLQRLNDPATKGDPNLAATLCNQSIPPPVYEVSLRLTDLAPKDGQDGVLATAALPISAVLFVLGASFMGAEWRTGTIATWLTWEPRRIRVGISKILAAGLGAMVLMLLAQLAVSLAFMPTFLIKGTTFGADNAWLGGLVGVLARCMLLGAFAAGAGTALALLVRSTGVAAAMLVAYMGAVEVPLQHFSRGARGWLLENNIAVFLSGHLPTPVDFHRTLVGSAAYLFAILTLICVIGLVTFNRRDVQAG